MAELSTVHRYAAGGLLALALGQVQIHQCVLTSSFGFPPIIDPEDGHFIPPSLNGEDSLPWSSKESGLLRHIFRYLKIEEKAWVGLEITSVSPDAKHHIGAFLKMLSEEETDLSSSSIDQAQVALANAVDAMTISYKHTSGGDSQSCSEGQAHPEGDVSTTGSRRERGQLSRMNEVDVVMKQRKVAVMYELLAACVADTSEEKHGRSLLRAGYDARQRVALRLLAIWLDIEWSKVAAMELMVAYMAMAAQKEREQRHVDDEEVAKSRWSKWRRGGLIGAAAVTGGTLLAITGGLAAPAIAAGMAAIGTAVPVLGASGLAAAAAVAGSAAGSVAVAASFGAAGAGLTGFKMARRTAGIDEFQFIPIGDNHQQGRLAVAIAVSGIAFSPEDFVQPWQGPDGDLERYAIWWESNNVMAVSTAIQDWLTSSVAKEMMKRGAMLTVLSGLLTALAWPAALLGATDFIDSKWSVAVDRSDKAGKLLATVLLKGGQGNRPVTLVGFSLGARVIFKCLEELAKIGDAGGIVERVVLLGAPVKLDKQKWETVRKVVAGRFVNGYSTNDWILGIAYRATFLTQGLAGLQAVEVPGIENVDVTEVVRGHSSYLSKAGELLRVIDIDSFYPIYPPKLSSRSI